MRMMMMTIVTLTIPRYRESRGTTRLHECSLYNYPLVCKTTKSASDETIPRLSVYKQQVITKRIGMTRN